MNICIFPSAINFYRASLLIALASASSLLTAQITREWVGSYNGQGDFNDRYTCTVQDGSGNIYLGGSVTNNDVDRDYLLVKVDASGSLLWRRELNNLGNGSDEITAIVLDASGNVLVTGLSKSVNTGTDYRTVKYDPSGSLLWQADYNNPVANGYDQANAIAVDANGNVYVTGQSDGDPSSNEFDDYATVKYNAAGQQQWVARYDGLGSATDRAVAVHVDGSGSVYVTGRSDNGGNDDYVTIKYNAAGVQQWLKQEDRGGRDRATAMALDANGNLYITGRSDNGNNDDFWTLKYNSAGALLWQQPYDYVEDDRPTAIALDPAGNVYVTGQSDGDASPTLNWDYQTVAYSTNGAQLWQQRYNGAASNDDVPAAVVSDGTNVFVTGISDADPGALILSDIRTFSYNAGTGAQNWTASYAGTAGLDDEGKAVIITPGGAVVAGNVEISAANKDALVVKYNTTGVQQWLGTVTGVGDNNENIRAMRVDAANNVYAAGYSTESRQNRNMALVKFASNGAVACHFNLNGTSPASPDEAQAIELTNAGEPVVAGYTKNSGESNDITFFRADPATCDTVWTRQVITAANGSDKVYDMVRDAAGNFYMTGRVDNDPSFAADDDAYTAKFNVNGTLLWGVTHGSGAGLEDRGSYIRVASSGNVYITGRAWNGADFDIFTIKYNSNGGQQWIQTFSGGEGNDEPTGLALDASENVVVCGRAAQDTALFDYVTLKYSSAGALAWSQLYDGTGAGDDQAEGLAIDAVGGVHVTGTSDRAAGTAMDMDMVTVKYDPSGAIQWARNVNGSGAADDVGDAIAVNAAGQIYVTGHTNAGSQLFPNYDATTIIYDASGAVLWSDTYNSPADSSEVPAVLVLKGNDFYVGGYSIADGQMRNMMVIKYSGTVVGEEEAHFGTFAIAPNPFKDVITLRNAGGYDGIIVHDAHGRMVAQRSIGPGQNSIYLADLAPGVYACSLMLKGITTNTIQLVHIP